MTILFFDCETTGLIDFKADLMVPHQPRIVQLAAVLTEDDGTHICILNAVIKPDGWTIDEEGDAFKTHGIANARCEAEGRPMRDVLTEFNAMKASAKARAAYNIMYDKKMLAREAGYYGIPHSSEGLESHCVMLMAKPICKLPPTDKMMATGRKDFKTPKLSEAYRHFFGCDMDGAHDAMNDVIATIAIFFKIRELKQKAA